MTSKRNSIGLILGTAAIGLALGGCGDSTAPVESPKSTTDGGAMDKGKMEGGMDKGKMEGGAMDKGKMEGGAMDKGKMDGEPK